jgi:GNAT superfamily N-acetyltransferase
MLGWRMAEIRRANETDAGAIARLLSDAFVQYRPLYTVGGYNATTPSADGVRRRMAEGPVWLAVDGARLVGTVAAVVRDEELWMRGMAVSPLARRCGIGRRLIAEVERFAVERGHDHLALDTTPFLVEAIGLYERAGFVRVTTGGARHLYGTPLIKMSKKIGTP